MLTYRVAGLGIYGNPPDVCEHLRSTHQDETESLLLVDVGSGSGASQGAQALGNGLNELAIVCEIT
jgi:hypothetical protein